MRLKLPPWARSYPLIIITCVAIALLFVPYAYVSGDPNLPGVTPYGVWSYRFGILAALWMTAGASFVCAALVGFIVAVGHEPAANSARYGANLTQLSNWITGLVVGLGLVQFGEISDALRDFSMEIAALGTSSGTGWPLVLSLILFYAASGFLSGALFTVFDFPRLLERKRSL